MPRGCRYPGRTAKPRLYEVVLIELSTLTAQRQFGGNEEAVLAYCIKQLRNASFFPEERQHIATHLHNLAQRDESTRTLLAPLIELFPYTPVTPK